MNVERATLIPAFHDVWHSPACRDAVALVGLDGQFSYAQLAIEVGTLSGRLRAAGLRDGDRVAIAMQRSTTLAVALLAVMTAGACPCVLEPKLGRDETVRRFGMTGMRWLLTDPPHRDDPALDALPGVTPLCLPDLPAAGAYWALDTSPDAAGLLLFTSGSSGKPKGVLQSHRGLRVNSLGLIEHSCLSTNDRLLHVMPLHHTNGVNNQLLAPLLAGACVILADRFKAEDMPGLMERHAPTLITGVPTMYSRMLGCEFSERALAALRMARCGSAPITEELHRRVEAKLGRPLVVSYGLSEATCTSTMNPPSARRIGSVGTVLAGQRVYLADADGNAISGHGRDGEICIDGPSLMLGYLDEHSGGTARPVATPLRTGDLGRFDEDGYLFITGRIKDVIIRGGENLSPHLIESVLCKLPGVSACCVVGKPDADLGEVPWAFIVRANDGQGALLDAERMGSAVQLELSRIHKPAGFVFIERLPENSVGKVDRKTLAASLR